MERYKMEIKNLKEIVTEIELTAKEYKISKTHSERETYNQYVSMVILDATKSDQYDLCNYWEKLKRG